MDLELAVGAANDLQDVIGPQADDVAGRQDAQPRIDRIVQPAAADALAVPPLAQRDEGTAQDELARAPRWNLLPVLVDDGILELGEEIADRHDGPAALV
jgi:hypothetical protein